MTKIHRIISISQSLAFWLGSTLTFFLLGAIAAQASSINLGVDVRAPGQIDETTHVQKAYSAEVAGGKVSWSLDASALGTVRPLIDANGVFRLSGYFSATAEVYANYTLGTLNLGFHSHAEGQGGFGTTPFAYTTGGVNINDSFTLTGEDTGVLAKYGSVLMNWTVNGRATGSLTESNGDHVIQGGYIIFGVNSQFVEGNLDGSTGNYGIFSPSLSAELDLISGSVSYSASLNWTHTVNWGFMDLLYNHTATLSSITFPDGTTPESHGLEIVFESGITSPNLIVPEPSTFALLGPGVAGFLSCRWRQRKRKLFF